MSLNNLANVLRKTGRPKEAEAAYTEALAIFKQLVADFPNRAEFRRELADAEADARPSTKAGGLQEAGRGTGDQPEKKPTNGDLGNLDSPKK
jgi:hypothetical protein